MLKEILWRGKSCVYSSTLKFLNNVAFGVCNIICNQIYLKYIFIWKLKCKFRPLKKTLVHFKMNKSGCEFLWLAMPLNTKDGPDFIVKPMFTIH